ncbi:mercury(II) reductase [Conexibacter sp. DBS9H8]|uniref:mercury(II) reductase n=1 Tax=Conexibacter sp. DBS9H8 TaxID=2937801 RepID=UPI00200ED849|nr:mercury(II) reductase [Conexibacter sp. DBS9H8]
MSEIALVIEGMTCADCARHVRHGLEEAGAQSVVVDWRAGTGTIAADGPSLEAMNRALADTRYRVRSAVERGGQTAVPDGGDIPDADYDYDLIVLGSGGGAFAGAIRARDLGKSVLMVEAHTIGGTCVNVGCIPSKSLLVSSLHHDGADPGALAQAVSVKAEIVERLRQEKYVDLIDEYGIELRRGTAQLSGPHSVTIGEASVTAARILIATGARPQIPEIPGLAEAGYLTSTTALELTDVPRRLAVIGANAVGLELGQMLGNFGSQVTFISRRALTPRSEPEISEAIRRVLEGQGHTVLEHASTRRVRPGTDAKMLEVEVGSERIEVEVDAILVAAGRRPNTEQLNLAAVGVVTDTHGAIVVDDAQRTSVSSIYAAGDVTTQPQFVYVAAAGGAAAAENALTGAGRHLDLTNLPQIIFTSPQIALAGLTEQQAREAGFVVQTSVLPLSAIPRAIVNGDTDGLFKLVADAGSGRLLGASIIADAAGEVIQSAVLAIKAEMTFTDLASTWAPYLTMAEGLKLAAQTFGRDVAKLSCCAA